MEVVAGKLGELAPEAQNIQDGTVCVQCGMYFQDPKDKDKAHTHGYPVACKVCFRPGMRRDGIQKALVKTI